MADYIIIYNVTYAINEISFLSFLIGMIISGVFIIASFGVLEFYKSSYFSGFPYINKKASTSLSYMKKTFCFWIVGKFIGQSICLFLIISSKIEDQDLGEFMKGKTVMGFMLYFIYAFELILTEVLPGRLVLKRKYLEIFEGSRSNSTTDELLDSTGMIPEGFATSGDAENGGKRTSMSFPKPVSEFNQKRRKSLKIMKVEQLNIPDLPRFSKKHGFGPIFFGDVDGNSVRIRQLKINDISTFQLREIPNEIKKWKKIQFPSIESYLGEYHETDQYYYIISEAHEALQALSDILDPESKTPKLTALQKAFICKNVIKTMLHLGPMGDDYSHGHLCPSNILVNCSHQVDSMFNRLVIQDFGFSSLKAYCSMLSDYSNKDQYSAPEHLKQKGKVVKKSTHKGDVYSIGMLL